MATLRIEIRRRLSEFSLDIALELNPGIHVLFGHSGVGKTQTLECIAGLAVPDSGEIVLDDTVLFRRKGGVPRVNLAARSRGIGYVMQEGALFPHRTLSQNVAYPIKRRGRQDRGESLRLLEEMGIQHLAERFPAQISGGQRRRVAVARALASDPSVLLLDEPFVHLDQVVRFRLMNDLARLVALRGMIALLVTHDLDVAARMAETISVIESGKIIQSGPKEEVLFRPATGGIARLFGSVTMLEGVVEEESGGVWHVRTGGLEWRVIHFGTLRSGQPVELAIRIGAVKVVKPGQDLSPRLELNRQSARLVEVERRPDFFLPLFELEPKIRLAARMPADTFERTGLRIGDVCQITVLLDGLSLYPLSDEAARGVIC